jgi:ABC-type Na+ transport system ATPase subunit NatA
MKQILSLPLKSINNQRIMWVEKLTLENIKCFDNCEMVFGTAKSRYKWVTLLGENGGGKSTALQALGLLLAGPEGVTIVEE